MTPELAKLKREFEAWCEALDAEIRDLSRRIVALERRRVEYHLAVALEERQHAQLH